jgi:hypothetical protein
MVGRQMSQRERTSPDIYYPLAIPCDHVIYVICSPASMPSWVNLQNKPGTAADAEPPARLSRNSWGPEAQCRCVPHPRDEHQLGKADGLCH